MSYKYFIVKKVLENKTMFYVRGLNAFGNKTLEPLSFFVEDETIEEGKARLKKYVDLLVGIDVLNREQIKNRVNEGLNELIYGSYIEDKNRFMLQYIERYITSQLEDIYFRTSLYVSSSNCAYYAEHIDKYIALLNDEVFNFQNTDLSKLSEEQLELLEKVDYIHKCDNCGEYFYMDNLVETEEGDFFCEDCVADRTFICDYCGCRHTLNGVENENFIVLNDRGYADETWCRSCVSENATKCSDDNWYRTNSLQEVHRDNDDYYNTFYETGDYCNDNCRYYDNEDEWWTMGCWDDAHDMPYYYSNQRDWEEECETIEEDELYVQSYSHTFDDLRLYGMYTSVDFFKGIGFELEIARKNNEVNEKYFLKALTPLADKRLVLKRDSSIDNDYGSGIEIVSYPHTFEEFWKNADRWSEIQKLAKQFNYVSHDANKADVSCGLHFHISRTVFGDNDRTRKENIAKVMYFFDKFYDDIIKFSRRKKSDATSWANKYGITSYSGALSTFERYNCGEHGDRYKAVNITNRTTVEYRIMRGTLIPETFLASADFVMTISQNSNTISTDCLDDINQWLKGIRPETIEYIKSRNAFEQLNLGGNE